MCYKNAFIYPTEKQAIKHLKDYKIEPSRAGRENGEKETGCDKTDKEERELFLRLELPLIITGWIIFFITYGYLLYVGR